MRTIRIWLGAMLGGVLVAVGVVGAVPSATAEPAPAPAVVELTDGTDPESVARKVGVDPRQIFTEAGAGFAADLTTQQISKLKSLPDVLSVAPDRIVARIKPITPRFPTGKRFRPGTKPYLPPDQFEQYVAPEIRRVGTPQSRTADIDGRDDRRVNVDIAILDGGVDPYHPDLNVVGGYDCVRGPRSERGWGDRDGHGTLVAGQAAAIDNAIGVVGTAPGARIWSLRVANPDGFITDSAVFCALDYLARHSQRIEVANLSFSGENTSRGPCISKRVDPAHWRICRVVKKGVSVVVAAGNSSADAAFYTPAAYNEVIAVSATVDFDGKPGGLAPVPPECFPTDVDDTFAVFSNYGKEIDVAAPGVCSLSTYPGGLYAVSDGTSFAAPLVAGGAALLLVQKAGPAAGTGAGEDPAGRRTRPHPRRPRQVPGRNSRRQDILTWLVVQFRRGFGSG